MWRQRKQVSVECLRWNIRCLFRGTIGSRLPETVPASPMVPGSLWFTTLVPPLFSLQNMVVWIQDYIVSLAINCSLYSYPESRCIGQFLGAISNSLISLSSHNTDSHFPYKIWIMDLNVISFTFNNLLFQLKGNWPRKFFLLLYVLISREKTL